MVINRDLSLERVLGFEPKIDDEEDKNQILFFVQYYDQAQLLYYLCNKAEDQQDTLLINYTKFGGYQICVYSEGEIITEVEDLKNINKNEFLEKNIELISGYIRNTKLKFWLQIQLIQRKKKLLQIKCQKICRRV